MVHIVFQRETRIFYIKRMENQGLYNHKMFHLAGCHAQHESLNAARARDKLTLKALSAIIDIPLSFTIKPTVQSRWIKIKWGFKSVR